MFHFRFETLLSQRRNAEERLQKELAEARRALAAAQDALAETKKALRHCAQDMRRKLDRRFRAADIRLYAPYLERLRQEVDARQKRVAAADRNVAHTRQALIEAMKKRKILDRLKERQHETYLKEASRRERKFVDEVAGRHHTRKNPASA
jgi:flagellar FliJ protein